MKRCIICGTECDNYICETCAKATDIESVCFDLMRFKPDECENTLWVEMAEQMENPYDLRRIAFEIADMLDAPRRQYVQMISLANNGLCVKKDSRNALYGLYDSCDCLDLLSEGERNRARGLLIDALYKDYLYQDAEDVVAEVLACDEIPLYTYATLAEYYTTTRRYDAADKILAKAAAFALDDVFRKMIEKRQSENDKQRAKKEQGKKEYLPAPREERAEIQQRYIAFLNSVGVEAELPMPSMEKLRGIPSPIKRDRYPDPVIQHDPDFDTFVAFDLETTGLSAKYNSIIEIGAIKVVGGEVVETGEFTFQEFVKPFRSSLTEDVEALTSITLNDVMFAREMWEVFPDFMDFADDNILLGYNCNAFDSRFMTRAGRYSHIIIENPYFDVMLYAARFKDKLGLTCRGISLETLSNTLGIENPAAHRALADAITTAKVFLKLKEIER